MLAVVAASVALAEDDPAIEHPRSGVGTRLSETLPIRLRAGDGLGALTVASGDVWANDYGREQLVRLDAAAGACSPGSPSAGASPAAGEGSLWALRWGGRFVPLAERSLFRIDPSTNRVAARIPLRAPSGEPMIGFGVLVGEGGVWVGGPSRVIRLDPSSGRVLRELSAGADRPELTSAVLHAGGLLAVSAGGQLVRFDLRRRVRRGAPEPALETAELLAAVGDRGLGAVDGTLIAADAWTGRVQVAPTARLPRLHGRRVRWRPSWRTAGRWAIAGTASGRSSPPRAASLRLRSYRASARRAWSSSKGRCGSRPVPARSSCCRGWSPAFSCGVPGRPTEPRRLSTSAVQIDRVALELLDPLCGRVQQLVREVRQRFFLAAARSCPITGTLGSS